MNNPLTKEKRDEIQLAADLYQLFPSFLLFTFEQEHEAKFLRYLPHEVEAWQMFGVADDLLNAQPRQTPVVKLDWRENDDRFVLIGFTGKGLMDAIAYLKGASMLQLRLACHFIFANTASDLVIRLPRQMLQQPQAQAEPNAEPDVAPPLPDVGPVQ